jgi:hypothetical protein
MADTKISALTASTTPLAGTEVLPIVQGGVTKQVSVANLTAGRAISATQLTLTTGNLIVANGQGIDFSATPGTGTSELFADYEEGTFTPTVLGSSTAGTANYTVQVGRYTKIGNRVFISGRIVYNTLTGTGNLLVGGLPFTVANVSNNYAGVSLGDLNGLALTALNTAYANTVVNTTQFEFTQTPTGGGSSTAVPVDAAASFMFAAHYEA